MSEIRPPSGVNTVQGAQQWPNEEGRDVQLQPQSYTESRYFQPNESAQVTPFANEIIAATSQANIGRTMSDEDLRRMLQSILMGRSPLKPDTAEIRVAGAIDALSLARGSGWVRPYVPNDHLIELLRGGPEGYAQQLLGAYSVFEGSEGSSKQRLFYELRELLSNSDHPLHGLATLYYGSFANWIRSSIRNNEKIPGGVLSIKLKNEKGFTRTVYYISDLHGNAHGLWQILNMHVSFNETLLQAMYLDKAVLILGGDGWLPVFHNDASLTLGVTSMDALLLLLSELPGNFIWAGGNHDPLIRIPEILTGGEKAIEIRNAIIQTRGTEFLFNFQEVVDRLPNLVFIRDEDEIVAIGGHTPVANITPEQAVLSPFDPDIRRRLTFGRLDPVYLETTMGPMRRSMRAPNAVFLAGHIHPRNDSRSAFRPYIDSRGILVMRAYGHKITGVKVASHSPTQVVVEDFVGNEKSRLNGRDLRAEVLKMNDAASGIQRRTRSFYRSPKVNYAGLPPIEVLVDSWVEGVKFIWGILKNLLRRSSNEVNAPVITGMEAAPVVRTPLAPVNPMGQNPMTPYNNILPGITCIPQMTVPQMPAVANPLMPLPPSLLIR